MTVILMFNSLTYKNPHSRNCYVTNLHKRARTWSDCSGSLQDSIAGLCEHDDETSVCMKNELFYAVLWFFTKVATYTSF
jgi:hypothetical protein